MAFPDESARRGRRRGRRAIAVAAALAAVAVGSAAVAAAAYGSALRARLRADAERAVAERLPRARVEGDLRVDARLRVVLGPIVVPSDRAGAPPVLRVERAAFRPRLGALLRGHGEVAELALEDVHLEPGPRLEGLTALARDVAAREHRVGGGRVADLEARGVRVTLSDVTATLPRAGAAAPLEVGPIQAALRVRRDGGAVAVAYAARSGRAHAEGTARIAAAGSRVEATFDARAGGLWLAAPRLATEPVGPLALSASGVVRCDTAARRIALEGARILLGERGEGAPAFAVDAALDARGDAALVLDVRADDVDWGALVAALPRALRPPPAAPAVSGALGGALHVSGPLRRPAAWRIAVSLDASRVAPAPGAAAVLAAPFTYTARLPGDREREVVVGPANPSFVPLGALPRHVVRAVLASEDAGFFAHHGFDLDEIQQALATAGGRRRLRGASTISQQLAKNLYLTPERTLARKVREALVTVALEASVPKRRLLEIYLNVAEWGDGVVGIGEAARHWFGKDARDLTPKEAAFLASVIPNPVRYEMYRRRGALTEAWEARVRDLLVKLRAADALSDEQLRDAWDAPLVFAHG
jgi:penicillin-binding protein 1A